MSSGRGRSDVPWTLYLSGIRREISQPVALLSQGFFICLILFVFSHLWEAAFKSGFSSSAVPADYVWYLLVTEIVVLCPPQIFREIQDEVRSGDLLQRLLKPIAYPLCTYLEALGRASVRMLVLGLIGTAFTLVATGQAPGNITGFIAALLLVPLSTAVLLLFYTAIGLLSVWMFDAMPVYWVFSKAMYVLGGLMIPISIYPDWLQRVAACTPFYALLYGVSRQTISFSTDVFILSATMLAGWAVLAVLLICRIYSRVNRTICLGGG